MRGIKNSISNCIFYGVKWDEAHSNRKFTTDKDMMDVFRSLVDSGQWSDFYFYANKIYRQDKNVLNEYNLIRRKFKMQEIAYIYDDEYEEQDYVAWLIYNPERFCCLVAQAIEEGVIKV